jgi:2,3-bisphosphoglycerate-independent phosphoglycerate mutase
MVAAANRLGAPLVLMILDGFGEREAMPDNAITRAKMPRWHALLASCAHTTIGTSGPDVGLPVGQMGNSEVGHLNFGAGRVAQMDISRIDCAVADGSIATNPEIAGAIVLAKANGGRLHLLGLVSDGGVHSSIEHLLALVEVAAKSAVKVVVHAFLDGRDTAPKSAAPFVARVVAALDNDRGVVGTVSGRYFAMDRDKRWDRVEKAYFAIASATSNHREATAAIAIEKAYARGETDEFVLPTVIGDYAGVDENDVALFFNFRPDRARELSAAFTAKTFDGFARGAGSHVFSRFVCMTQYDASLALPVAFTKPEFHGTFPEVIARAGFKQLRCAETEKYAHVTYFFNGGVEQPFPGEERILVPSPKSVATYDLQPEMSAPLVAEKVADAIATHDLDFVLVNFANPDMVGHTGNLDAAIAANEFVDAAIGRVVDATLAKKGVVIITADHGNCEQMIDEVTGAPFTQHTTNRVPLLIARGDGVSTKLRDGGRIADVAPTMLKLFGLELPVEMTGESLLVR